MKISKSILFFTTLFFINLNAQDIPPEVLERMPAEMKEKMMAEKERNQKITKLFKNFSMTVSTKLMMGL